MISEDIVKDIRKRCRLAMNGIVSDSMRNKGLNYKLNFGLSLQKIKEIANIYTPEKHLAEYLWKQDVRELKILATLLYPADEFGVETADEWEKSIPNQEIREQLCFNLLQYLSFAGRLVGRWAGSPEENTRITGYWLLTRILIQKRTDFETKLVTYTYILSDINSESIFLRNAALSAIKYLGRQSKETAMEILEKIRSFNDSDKTIKKEIYENILFEFEYYLTN